MVLETILLKELIFDERIIPVGKVSGVKRIEMYTFKLLLEQSIETQNIEQ